ncbi:beta-glucosidase-like glycosyl hydrolase [Bartonella heixiaziensis]
MPYATLSKKIMENVIRQEERFFVSDDVAMKALSRSTLWKVLQI